MTYIRKRILKNDEIMKIYAFNDEMPLRIKKQLPKAP